MMYTFFFFKINVDHLFIDRNIHDGLLIGLIIKTILNITFCTFLYHVML